MAYAAAGPMSGQSRVAHSHNASYTGVPEIHDVRGGTPRQPNIAGGPNAGGGFYYNSNPSSTVPYQH